MTIHKETRVDHHGPSKSGRDKPGSQSLYSRRGICFQMPVVRRKRPFSNMAKPGKRWKLLVQEVREEGKRDPLPDGIPRDEIPRCLQSFGPNSFAKEIHREQ